MQPRQLTEAEFREAYVLLFEGGRPVRECVIHVRGLDQRTLKRAYRRRAQETHPDRAHLRPVTVKDPEAEFRAVVAAYELLRLVQQGDVVVAAVRASQQREPRRPARPTRSGEPRATRDRPAAGARQREAGDDAEHRTRARQERRAHRQEQPFSAGSSYARWQGRGREAEAESRRRRERHRDDEAAQARYGAAEDRRERGEFPLPQRPLQLGQFLYYSGAVSWRQLIDALVWQRRQRPLIGQLAVAWGLMTREQIADVLTRRRVTGQYEVPFAEFALQCGYLNPSQHRALCGRAQLMTQRLGRFFVEQDILSEQQLNHYLKAMRLHNWRVKRRAQVNG